MALATGSKLGPYEIVGPLGTGGMGEVYRARDTRLERTVAIKILPVQFSSDPVRKQRFEREAKTISSLNHPHICVLYDVGSQDGVDYLVMECVEGETLAKRLEKGALPLEQVLKYGMQIADALDKAHRSGVIHRDLKPGNIMLTSTGAKLLDFGLAKPAAPLASLATMTAAVTQTSPMTEQGAIVGTFQYMSPEQVEGKELDGRSDIFSLGAVLYEMLTGQRAFLGKSQLSVASAILEKEPAPISTIKPMTPPVLDHAIRRCLAKEPEKRWQSAADLAGEFQWIAEAGSQAGVPVAAVSQPKMRERPAWAATLVGLGMIAGVIFAGLVFRNSRGPETPKAVSRFSLFLPAGDVVNFGLSFSPDGSALVYDARRGSTTQMYKRLMNRLETTPLPGTEGAQGPFFSPDGQWIAFFAGGKLNKMSVNGGLPVGLCEVRANRGGSWGPDGTIVFSPTIVAGSLMRVSAAGGTPQKLTELNMQTKEITHRWPEILPGGTAVVYVIGEARDVGLYEDSKIAVERLDTHEKKILPILGTFPRYSSTGHLLFARQNRIFAAPFDLTRLEVTGPPAPVLDDVAVAQTGIAAYAVSDTGSLAYVPRSATSTEGLLEWTDRKGSIETLRAPTRDYFEPHVSPDGQRVAVTIGPGASTDIWVYDIPHGTLTRLTFDGHDIAPVWSPDGKRIAYAANRSGGWEILSKSADGSGAEET